MLLYVGRFTEVKRIPLLIEAYERARPGFARRAPLVLVGGFPGEWEGEHPLRRDPPHRRAGRLPRRLARPPRAAGHPRRRRRDRPARRCASSSARCWSRAMACGLPAIAVDALRPGGHRRPRRDRLAGRARRPRIAGQRARRGGQPPGTSAAGAARNAAARRRASATPGRRSPSDVADALRRRRARRNIVARKRRTERLIAASDATRQRVGRLASAEPAATVFAPFRALGWGSASPDPSPAYA